MGSPVLIGLSGYSKVGKDTIASAMIGFKRVAFADALKEDLRHVFNQLGMDVNIPEHKEKMRPLLIEYGKTARKIHPDYWISRIEMKIDAPKVVITDVRYLNEAEWIIRHGGRVYYIERNCPCGKCNGVIGPSSTEEKCSIEILRTVVRPPVITNNGTPKDAVSQILGEIGIVESI